jgi:predicted RNase H-like nuclease (RuvC/YqgF family)
MTDASDLRTDIALIHKDIAQIEKTLGKLDLTLEKFAGISNTLALQERIVETHEKRLDELDEKITTHYKEEEDFRKQLQKQIQDLSESNRDYIEEFKTANVAERELRHKEVIASIDALRVELKEKNKEQDGKIAALENWRWWVMGVGVAVTTIVTLAWKTIFGG